MRKVLSSVMVSSCSPVVACKHYVGAVFIVEVANPSRENGGCVLQSLVIRQYKIQNCI